MAKRQRERMRHRLTARFSTAEADQIQKIADVMPAGDDKISNVIRTSYRFWLDHAPEARRCLDLIKKNGTGRTR